MKAAMLVLSLSILFGASSCSKSKCHVAMLSFHNARNEKVIVRVYGLGEKKIEMGEKDTFKLKPYVSYPYDVMNYEDGLVLSQGKESVKSCVTKEINIR